MRDRDVVECAVGEWTRLLPRAEIIQKLNLSPDYVTKFGALYGAGITTSSVKNAIATFERSLNTPNSRFDQYLRGDETALTATEVAGYNEFKSFGCVSCHQGANVGGNMFQRFGVMEQPGDAPASAAISRMLQIHIAA